MKRLHAGSFSLSVVWESNKNSSMYVGKGEDCAELIMLVNVLEF